MRRARSSGESAPNISRSVAVVAGGVGEQPGEQRRRPEVRSRSLSWRSKIRIIIRVRNSRLEPPMPQTPAARHHAAKTAGPATLDRSSSPTILQAAIRVLEREGAAALHDDPRRRTGRRQRRFAVPVLPEQAGDPVSAAARRVGGDRRDARRDPRRHHALDRAAPARRPSARSSTPSATRRRSASRSTTPRRSIATAPRSRADRASAAGESSARSSPRPRHAPARASARSPPSCSSRR